MKRSSKRYKEILKNSIKDKKINSKEALELVKKNCTTKFDESIDVSLKINLKQSKGGDLSLRTVVNLPNGSGKKNKIAVVCEQDKINEAKRKFSKEFKHICLGISASGPTKRWDIKNFIKLCININARTPSKFYLAAGNNDKDLIDQFLNSELSNNCISFKDLKISETLPIIKNCNLYIGNDTGWLHISSALGVKCLALFMDSPVQAYGKYSKNIEIIVPEGETEETTTHDTLGADKISFEKVFNKTIKLLS